MSLSIILHDPSCVNVSITVLAMLTTNAGHSAGQGLCPGARVDKPILFGLCRGRDGEEIGAETWAMPATPLTLGRPGLCLDPFYLLLPCSPWKQECCGVSLFGLSITHHHKWDTFMVLCLTQLQKLFRVWDYFVLFFPVPLFSMLPVLFSLIQGDCIGQFWDYKQPHINEELYSISQECDCLVPCQLFHTNTLFSSHTKRGGGGVSNLVL